MNTAVKSIFDMWTTLDVDDQLSLKIDVEHETVDDPIAMLIQVLGNDSNKWYELTYKFSEIKDLIKNKKEIAIEPFAREWSEKIRSYYKNKYFLNRLKNREVSNFQETVEEIISQGNIIKENQFAPLFKLPYFYLEDVAVEDIVKNSVSIKSKLSTLVEDDFNFVTKIKRFGKSNDRYVRFLLQNSKKQLLSIVITENNTSFPLWNYLYESNSSVNYKGHTNVGRFKGMDFKYYNIDNAAYSIRINKT